MSNKAIRLLLVLAVAFAALAIPTFAQDDEFDSLALYENQEGAFSWDVLEGYQDLGLEGETVTIFGAFVDSDAAAFEQAIAPFEEVTGIDIQYEGSGDFETLIRVRVEGNDAPDIAAFPQPGLFNDLGSNIVPVTDEIATIMNEEFDSGWTTLSTIDGELKGIVYRANTKSLVWYNPTAVEDAGYDEFIPPATWDDMLELSDLMVADGVTPWCVGIESSGATGWVITDWVEDVLLRTAPPETYDAWVANEIPFDDPAIVNALNIVGDVVLNEDYVAGGRDAILTTPFGDSPSGLFAEDPECYMHRQASFIPGFFPDGVEIAEDGDAWAFYLPPIDEEFGSPVLTAGDIFAAFNDDAATMAALQYLAEPLAQELWAAQGGFVAPNTTASLDVYPTELDRFYGELIVEADTVRFDASDQMPGFIGAGEFWTQMVNWVAGDATVEEALGAVEATWAQGQEGDSDE